MNTTRSIIFLGLALVGACGSEGDRCIDYQLGRCLQIDRVVTDVDQLGAAQMEGRGPATTGNEAALQRVENLFRDLNLVPAGDAGGFRQAFDFDRYVLGARPALTFDGQSKAFPGEFVHFRFSGGANIEAPIVFAGYGITIPPFEAASAPECPVPETGYDDYAGIDVTGKIVLVLRHGPAESEALAQSCPQRPERSCNLSQCHWRYSEKVRNAASRGAAGLLLVQDYHHDGAVLSGASIGRETFDDHPNFPVVMLDRAAAEAAFPQLSAWVQSIDENLTPASRVTTKTASLSMAAQIERKRTENILAAVPGTGARLADEVIVVGAHIDHLGMEQYTDVMYPGADDNASGTAVVMELARALAGARGRLKRTVLLAAWNAEELGLLGSAHYVGTQPTFPLSKTVAALSVDMVGAGDGTGLEFYGATEAGNSWMMELANRSATSQGLPYQGVAFPPLYASDHAYFALSGIPALLLMSRGDHPNYHQPGDTIANLSRATLQASAQLIWALLEPLATGREGSFGVTVPSRASALLVKGDIEPGCGPAH